jgi:hypothetical protein
MRSRTFAIVAGCAAFLSSGGALAATEQTYEQHFAASGQHQATGLSLGARASDPAAGARNYQPAALRRLELVLPKGTGVDQRAARACTAAPSAFDEHGRGACPAASRVGAGDLLYRQAAPGPVTGSVTIFNRKRGFYLYVDTDVAVNYLLEATWRRTATGRLVLVVPVTPLCVPPGAGAADGRCRDSAGAETDEAVISRLRLALTYRTSGSGKTRRSLVTTPPCARGRRWIANAVFHYAGGSSKTRTSTQRCVPPPKPR